MSLDSAMDELYGAGLDDFVSERARLAKELRDADDRDGAQALAKLRKPTVAAWALNQLARRNRREVDLLLDAGHRFREAQAGVLHGADRDGFEQARKTEHDARSQLVREAETILREHGSAARGTVDQIAESLRASAVSEEGRELLARGRFVEPLRAQGFDLVSELAASLPPPAPGRPARALRREAEREAKQALRAAKEALRSTEAAARQAQREAERRRAEADDAERAAEKARSSVEAAVAAVEEAEQRLAEARGTAGS